MLRTVRTVSWQHLVVTDSTWEARDNRIPVQGLRLVRFRSIRGYALCTVAGPPSSLCGCRNNSRRRGSDCYCCGCVLADDRRRGHIRPGGPTSKSAFALSTYRKADTFRTQRREEGLGSLLSTQ